MYISKEMFKAWCADAVTKSVVKAVLDDATAKRIALSKVCGTNSNEDRFYSGVIRGIELAMDFDSLFAFDEEAPDAESEGTPASY